MTKTKSASKSWRVVNGISYPRPGRPRTGPGSTDEVRHEAGEVVELPADVVAAYAEHGDIEPAAAAEPTPAAAEDTTDDAGA